MSQPASLLDYALDEIRSRIQNGTYPPGHKLVTQEISDSLGISRTPVVQAINRLIAEGMAESAPRRGTFVAQLSPKKIKNILEIRYMIEMFTIKLAIKNLDYFPDTLTKMRALAEEFPSIGETEYARASEIDSKFHTLFVMLANNEQLTKMYQSNWSVGATYYMYSLVKAPMTRHQKISNDHLKLVELLAERDENGIRKLLENHMASPIEAVEWLIANDTDHIFIR
ncbi:GntR family transcriptional regulator [Fusibacter paucivorans]|uniref:GntR family transcriptional regulator n=1 Tax=Fusibacter paucivorans TaxID=76009 RepID=A0ABS5PM27_9FIRM|nr:GntR family transcriptional regulator [Fusibacter paucivorans]MBS7526198.1 GntR family transcriptional regulator [Fusibacter paucivorans]